MEIDEQEAVTLVQLRAGLMETVGGLLQADSRKGMLVVSRTEDTLTHVCWHPRTGASVSGPPERDVVVFPDECQLQSIPGQPRCFVLAFKDDPSRNMFFWMQQIKPDEDFPLVANFNKAVDGLPIDISPAPEPPPAVIAATVTPTSTSQPPQQQQQAPVGAASGDLASILSAALSAASQPHAARPGGGALDPTALATALLSQLAEQHGVRQRQQVDEGPGLHEVLKPDLLTPLMQQPGIFDTLAPHLPEEHRTQEHLVATVRSPQFQQQLATFSAALQTGQLDITQFGLQPKGFSIADFLEAIQDTADKEKQQQAGAGGSNPPAQ